MKKHATLALGLAALWLPVCTALAGTWAGGDGNWESDNWGLGGGWPGDGSNATPPTITTGDTVTLSGNLAQTVGGSSWTAPYFVLKAGSTLNIGGNITSSDFAEFGNWGAFTVNHTAGTFTQGFRFDCASASNAGTDYQSTYNLSGGVLDVNSNDFRFGYGAAGAAPGNLLTFNLSGTGDLQFGNAQVGQLDLHITGGSLQSTGTCNLDGYSSTSKQVHVDGTGATLVSFTTLDAFTPTGEATLKFTLAAAGVTPMTVTTLNGPATVGEGKLVVDASGYTGSTAAIPLIDYTTLNNYWDVSDITLILPAGYTGTVDNDVANTQVELNIVNPAGTVILIR